MGYGQICPNKGVADKKDSFPNEKAPKGAGAFFVS
jgi:hypothetical protein